MDNNELGEYRGCDRLECLYDDGGAVVAQFGIGYQFLDLERSEDLEIR